MTTEVVAVDPDRPDPALLDRAAAIIRSGGLVAFGTETVYGLGADATNPAAVARIFAAKGRPSTNPLIVHVADTAMAVDCVVAWPLAAIQLADFYWPGPLTLVLPRSSIIPDLVTAGQRTVGVRWPAAQVASGFIRRAGVPIAAPSANLSNRISPTRAEHVLKDLDGRVDLILDSGPCAVGIESTVLDLSGEQPTILRPGAVTAEEIAAIIKVPVGHWKGSIAPNQAAGSPGQLAIHYAPQTPAYRLDLSRWADDFRPPAGSQWGAVILANHVVIPPADVRWVRAYRLKDPRSAAAKIYHVLHRLDALELDFLVIVQPVDPGHEWLAVLDRVRRATRPWPESPPGG